MGVTGTRVVRVREDVAEWLEHVGADLDNGGDRNYSAAEMITTEAMILVRQCALPEAGRPSGQEPLLIKAVGDAVAVELRSRGQELVDGIIDEVARGFRYQAAVAADRKACCCRVSRRGFTSPQSVSDDAEFDGFAKTQPSGQGSGESVDDRVFFEQGTMPVDAQPRHSSSPSVGSSGDSSEPTEGEARKGCSAESADRWRPELRDKSTVAFDQKGDSLLEQYKKVSVALRELRRIVEESRSGASQPVESYSNHKFAEVSGGGHGEADGSELECVAAFFVRLEELFKRFEVLFGEFNQLLFEFKHQSSPSVGSSGDSSEPTEGEARKGRNSKERTA